MADATTMNIFYATDYLLEELAGFGFFKFLLLDDVVEKLAAADELHDEKELFRCLNNFKQLNDVRMSDEL